MKETDMKLVLHLDQKVKDQQSTLEKAGVPGFYITDNAKEITIQMYLLDFILRLSRIKFEPTKWMTGKKQKFKFNFFLLTIKGSTS